LKSGNVFLCVGIKFIYIKIKRAITEIENEGQNLKVWKVYRKTGIRKEYQEGIEQEVLRLIEDNSYCENGVGI
jgi:hypothetical protein